jgi:hypothetical protein
VASELLPQPPSLSDRGTSNFWNFPSFTVIDQAMFSASALTSREASEPLADDPPIRLRRGRPDRPNEVEPPGKTVFTFGSVEDISGCQQRRKLWPTIGGIETIRLRPLGVGQEDGGRRIVLERGKELAPNEILGKQRENHWICGVACRIPARAMARKAP